MRLLRGDHFAGEHELHGDPFAHEPRQTLRAAVAGNNPQLHFGLAELGGFAGQAEGAGHSDLASAAEGEPVDTGDHRLAQVLNQVKHALPAVRVLFARDPSCWASSPMSAPAMNAFSPAPVRITTRTPASF